MPSGGTNTVTQNTAPPEEVLQNYRNTTAQATNVAGQPYPTYNAPLIAGFNPEQQTAFGNINQAAFAASPFINQAADYSTNAATLLNPTNFGSTIAAYQNPYTKQVVDATQAQFNNQNQQAIQQLRGDAASRGAFGGDREAVAEGIAAGQQQLAQAPVIANLNSTGFNTSLNAAQANAWLNSQGAFSMGQLGQEAQQTGLAGANAQLQSGSLQQQLQQEQLNVPYQQYLAAQGFPYQTTSWLSGIDSGLGGASGGMGTTTSPGPSTLSQLGGLGVTGLSLAGATGAFGANGWLTGAGAAGAGTSAATAAGVFGTTAIDSSAGAAAMAEAALAAAHRGGRVSRDAGGPVGARSLHPRITPDVLESLGGLGALAAIARGERPGQDSNGGRVTGLDPVPVDMSGRGFDLGGSVSPASDASFGGNPLASQNFNVYAQLPTEKLHELAVRFPLGTPQGAMVAKALHQRTMAPQMPPAQGGGGFSPQGFAAGGAPDIDLGASDYDWRNDEPSPGQGTAPRDTGEPLPVPPIPPDSTSPGGFGGVILPHQSAAAAPPGATPTHDRSGFSGPWGTLLAAGLGMMAGRSPYPGVNIGQGGLEGLKYGETQKLRDEQQALRMQQQRWQQQYQAGLLDIRNKHEGTYADLASARAQQASAMAQVAMARAVGTIGNHATPGDLLSAGVSDLMSRENPETPGQNWTKADAVRHMQGVDYKADAAGRRADQGDRRLDISQDRADAVRAFNDRKLALQQQGLTEKQAHDQAMIDLGYARAAVSGVTGSRDIMGKPTVTLEDEARHIRALPGSAPTDGTGPLPMPKSAAEAVPGSVYNTARGPARWDGKQFNPVP